MQVDFTLTQNFLSGVTGSRKGNGSGWYGGSLCLKNKVVVQIQDQLSGVTGSREGNFSGWYGRSLGLKE
jgi:hypothetical protein